MECKHAVIMCIYNGDVYDNVKLAIDSIVNQSITAHLYIYIDGPVNSSLESLVESVSDNPNILIYRSKDNRGLAFGLNYLIDQIILCSEYEFISRMDSDDISLNNRLERQEKYFSEHPDVDVIGTYCTEFGSDYSLEVKKVPLNHNEITRYSVLRCPFIHPTVMFRMRVFENGNRYPTNTFFSEDLALWFELIENGVVLANVPEILLKYRLTESTLLRRKGIKKAVNEIILRYNYMHKMKLISFKNITFLLGKFFFHLMPVQVTKHMYKVFR